MKYAVIARADENSKLICEKIKHSLDFTYDEVNPDIVITVGGDGTILRAVHQYIDRIEDITFFGIKTGHLGFYTDWDESSVDDLVVSIKEKNYSLERFNLLKYCVKRETTVNEGYALNEITLINAPYVQVLDIYVDDEHFETFRGTGVCISTASGSTAYNKSLDGAIIDTRLEGIQLSEIASISSNAYRTLGSSAVFCKSRSLVLKPKCSKDFIVTMDHLNLNINDLIEVKCSLSNKKVCFGLSKNRSFWNRVKDSFI